MGVTDDETMSEEKMNESKSTAPDDLTKTKKNSDVELTEQDLQNVSGGGAGVLSVSNTVPNLTY
jgi:bacteriocin-like protein